MNVYNDNNYIINCDGILPVSVYKDTNNNIEEVKEAVKEEVEKADQSEKKIKADLSETNKKIMNYRLRNICSM